MHSTRNFGSSIAKSGPRRVALAFRCLPLSRLLARPTYNPPMTPSTTARVAVIGAGPIGLELAVALKQAGIPYLHFDARQIGHTIAWFAPQTRFFSSNERIAIAGMPLQTFDQSKCSREEYLAYLRSVVQHYDLDVHAYEPVTGLRHVGDGLELATAPQAGPRRYRVQQVILATGGTAHPRMLNIPGEDLSHVSHYFQDPHTYFRKRLLVVGGRNSAVEAALRCHHAGASVALSYRRAELDAADVKYWLFPEITGLMNAGKIQPHMNTVPIAISPQHVTLRDRQTQFTRDVPADFVLLMTGYEADMSLCRLAGVTLDGPNQMPVYNPRTMETNVPGIYLAGTVVGGTQQKYRVFIENCHIHVQRIVAALTGAPPPAEAEVFARPES